ncbi:Nuclease-like protein OS=Ureibacillus acetophenoni OX=614649 GN=SAMN05877842_10198 PE=4 SV=1 [Ureibacillus acetophenoni]
MLIIDRKVPSKLLVLDALKRRAIGDSDFQVMLDNLIERAHIGYVGEKTVDRIWQELQLPTNSMMIHSFESENELGLSHQMDTLFSNAHFILILEIKNVSGHIYYDENKHQFIRIKRNGEKTSFQSPIVQVMRHADYLERIGFRLGLTFPIEKAVVIAEPSCIIGDIPGKYPYSTTLDYLLN